MRAVRRERIRFQMQLLEGKFNPGVKGVRCRVVYPSWTLQLQIMRDVYE